MSLAKTLKDIFETEISKNFPSASKDIVKLSLEYFWNDIHSSCLSISEQRILSTTFLWIPKTVIGTSIIPTLARAKWEHIDAASNILFIHLNDFEAQDSPNGVDLNEQLSRKVRSVNVSCCDSESIVEDRVPLNFSKTMCYSQKPSNVYLELSKHIMGTSSTEAFSPKIEEIASMSKLPDKSYLRPNSNFRDIAGLYGEAFECFLLASDHLGLCSWLRANARKHDRQIHEEVDVFMDKLDSCVIKLQSHTIHIYDHILFLGTLMHSLRDARNENVIVWRSSWLDVMDHFQSMVRVYRHKTDDVFLWIVINAISGMISGSLTKFSPNYREIYQQSEEIEAQLVMAYAIKEGLQEIMDCFSRIFRGDRVQFEEVMMQGALSTMHDMMARCQSVCEILRFKQRYQSFLCLRASIKHMESALHQASEIYGIGISQQLNPYDITQNGSVTVELQELAVLLHRSEIQIMSLIHDHLKSLSSFKRVRFILKNYWQESPEPQIMEIQRNMVQIASDKELTALDCVRDEYIKHSDRISVIKGMPPLANILMRMKYISSIGESLDHVYPSEDTKSAVQRLYEEISATEREWTTKLAPGIKKSYKMLQNNVFIKGKDGKTMTNFRKDLWLGLSEMFWLQRLSTRNGKERNHYATMYFQPINSYHKFRSYSARIEKYTDLIGDECGFLLPILKGRLSNLDAMAVSTLSWASAPLDKLLEMMARVESKFASLFRVLNVVNIEIQTMGKSMKDEDFRRLVCNKSWQWDNLIEAMRETLHASIVDHGQAGRRVVTKSAQIIERWMETNLTSEESNAISKEDISEYSESLNQKLSEIICTFYAESMKNLFDILLHWEPINGVIPCKVRFESSEAPDPVVACNEIVSSLHQIQEISFDCLDHYCTTEIVDKNRDFIRQHLSKCSEELTKRAIHIGPAVPSSQDLTHASYPRLSDLDHKIERTNKDMKISLSIEWISTGSPKSVEKIIRDEVHKEIMKRSEALGSRIETTKNDCLDLNVFIKGIIKSQNGEVLVEIDDAATRARENLWDLEKRYEYIEYIRSVLRRNWESIHNHDEAAVSLKNILYETKSLLGPLQESLYAIETQVQEKIKSLGKEVLSKQEKLQWVNDLPSYKISHLKNKMNLLEMDLNQCIDNAIEGGNAVRELEYLSAKFRIDPGDLSTLQKATSILQKVKDVVQPHEDLLVSVDKLTSLSWLEGKDAITSYGKEASAHVDRLQKLNESMSSWDMFQEYKSLVESTKEFVDIITDLYSVDLKDRHWKQMNILPSGGTSALRLSDLWSDDILTQKSKIQEITSIARREDKLKQTFDALRSECMGTKILLATYKSTGEVFLEQVSTAETMEMIEDSIMTLNNMMSNRASAYFRGQVKMFLKELSNVEESMQVWLSTQSVWSYLEAVFDGGDIAAQMPEEAALFSTINLLYLENVRKISTNPFLLEAFQEDEVRDQFVYILSELEKCQKSLSAYLESKRKLFPRFYFVSDSTLLEILSNGSDPRSVQKHFQSGLFDGIDHLIFESDESNVATHIVSKEGEQVKLRSPFQISGPAEEWLKGLVDMMKDTMRLEARKAAKDVQKLTIKDFLFSRPAQMALLGLQIKWTADVQNALMQIRLGKKSALKKTALSYESTLSSMIELTLCSSLSKIERTSLETCITVFIHLKDVITELISKRVEDPKSFDWLKHCRFRWREDKQSVIISICDNDFEYGYEYLGVKERLVMTSLTDVCYVALTQAVGMNCGGAPAGPAGTGKTETTKDLGATLGKYVVVFNCSDQLDHQMMGRIFKGLAQAGFWGCFDEFNRIDLDVLSVCAQQLNCIFTALKERKKTTVFTDGDIVPVHPDVGYFITMNPGYAGRQELPENLKALFRGVTMMAPDRRMIMKVKLAATGFQDSDIISRKFDTLYTLCEEQLSKQPHYDFGLRNILSVLRTAGAAKRANPNVTEMNLIMKTLYDMNVSKFVSDDVSRFSGLINDVFPKRDHSKVQVNDFKKELEIVCQEEGLQFHADWAEKCVQLYESSIVRHGIMVVGPSRSGKSTAIEIVAKTLTQMGHKTSIWKMNPKSITAPQMFGKLDPTTGDWTDGIFSMLWKKAAKAAHSIWIVVDGPVDAVWIENLNTVLDDNKILTLANGDRIRMTSNMRLIFETENLNNASPATVSRAGVVFISSNALGWKPIILSYSQKVKMSKTVLNYLIEMVEGAIESMVECEGACHVGEAIMAESFIAYLDGFITMYPSLFENFNFEGNFSIIPESIRSVLAFCVVWGFTGTLSGSSRKAFTDKFKYCLPASEFLSQDNAIHDYMYDIHCSKWVKWNVPGSSTQQDCDSESIDYMSVSVHTLEELRCRYLMDLIFAAGKVPHVVGPQGSGKTTIVRQYCEYKQKEGIQSSFVTFSALTSPQMYQESFESYLEKRQGRNYGPAKGQRMIFAMDDISMPRKNAWGDQETNELIRQILELKGFYRLDKPIGEFKSVNDIYYLASSKLDFHLPNRLWGVMCNIYIDYPSEDEVMHIINGLIDIFLRHCNGQEDIEDTIRKLGQVVIRICNEAPKHAQISSDRNHYNFGIGKACVIVRSLLSKISSKCSISPEETVLICAHECHREIVDNLTSTSESDLIVPMIQRLISLNFPNVIMTKRLYFSSFFRDFNKNSPEYSVINDFDETRISIEKTLSSNREMAGSFVLFDDAINHIIRITRVIEMRRRSIILVGIGGSGKRSLSKAAASAANAKFIHSSTGTGYTVATFFDDLRSGLRESGIKGKSVCFMLSDSDISDDLLLDYVNQQLIDGRIAGIFQKEDMDSIGIEIRPAFKEKNSQLKDSEENLIKFFWERVSKHFHFVFCFSPSGKNFLRWLKQFPGFLSCCTIDWFYPWPFEALSSLSKRILYPSVEQSSNISCENISKVTSQIHNLMADLSVNYHQECGRMVHVTPKTYLTFIESVKNLYLMKANTIRDYLESLNSGLHKMKEAKLQVDKMNDELKEKQEVLLKSKKEIGELIDQVDLSTQEATIERQKVQAIVSRVTKKAEEILKTKLEAENDLEKAKPALESAVDALNSISSKDINSLKSLRKPPDVIKRIMDCVLILYHAPLSKIGWHEIKGIMVIQSSYEESLKLMNDLSFLQKLLTFPKDAINDETVELLQPYFRSADFNYASAKKASGNVAGLCNWAEAMCKYHTVARDVEPKIIRLKESEKELSVAKEEQGRAEEELDKVESTLKNLNQKLSEAKSEMNTIQQDAENTEMKMNNALTLIESLGGEEIRWQTLNQKSQSDMQSLLGDCVMACTFTCYLGPIGVSHRDMYIGKTKEICNACAIDVSPAFNPVEFLADGEQVSKWLKQGLPSDEFSIQNGALLGANTLVPYIIDPQGQCSIWLQQKYPNSLSIPFSSPNFHQALENCISKGIPILIQNAELEFGTYLDPIFDCKSREYIRIGDKDIEIGEGFQAILITRLANPVISPEKFAKCTILNFAVTFDGLEEQFLDFIVSRDEAHLNRKRQAIDEDVRKCENNMKQLEIDLLKRLSSYEGDILEDTHLVGVLAETKATSRRVLLQLKEASETKNTIAERCEKYRPCSKMAALLYFSLCDFSMLNHMYKTSLEQFKAWFSDSISIADKSESVSERVQNVLTELQKTVYEKAQVGFFESDKDPFRFLLASRIMQSGDQSGEIFEILGAILSMAKAPVKYKKKLKEWLSEEQWRNVLHLQQTCSTCFQNLASSMTSDESKWKAWIKCESPESSNCPLHSVQIGSLAHLAIIRALRPEKSKMALDSFVENTLGQIFLSSKGADLAEIASAVDFKTPIVCVISPGADPTSKIQDIARKSKIKCLSISMGQGQEILARKYLSTAEQRGDWVCIQNAHLAGAYLKELEDHLESLNKADPNFRLWITTEPCDTFPLGLLHMARRITCEAPSGLHDALVSLVSNFDNDVLEEVKMPQWKPLLLSLNIMHVLSQERKRFGSIGWVVPYQFSYTDLAASLNIVSNHLQTLRGKKNSSINWESLHYLVGSIQYGGRIIDDRDQRLMLAYCKRFLSNEVLNGSITLLEAQKFPKVAHLYKIEVNHDSTLESMLKNIQKLPSHDLPQIFGLDASAETASQILDADRNFNCIRVVMRTSGENGKQELGKRRVIEQTIESISSAIDVVLSNEKALCVGTVSGPLGTFLATEVQILRSMSSTVAHEVTLLKDVLNGTLGSSDQSDNLLDTLGNGKVPVHWSLRYQWRLDSIDLWLKTLRLCKDYLVSAVQIFNCRCIWIPGIANPKAMLNGVLQEYVRSSKDSDIKIDQVEIQYQVTKIQDPKSIKEPPKTGIYLYGCFLEGATWDPQSAKLTPNKETSVIKAFPVIHAFPAIKLQAKKKKSVFLTPLYTSETRTAISYLDYIPLPVDGDDMFWTQRGVALICKV